MLQKVAVISAGISGLTSIKACLEEGLQPECFESSNDNGGIWRFKDDPEPERANIYSSVIINSSKERMAFSDFPPPAELPNNMHHSEMLLYMRLYAQAFKLLQYIRFKTTVDSVRQTLDFASTGQWEVETESRDGQRETGVFVGVIVCTGHFTHPHLPLRDFPGGRNIFIHMYDEADELIVSSRDLNHLPSEETMLEGKIEKDTAIMHLRYACSERTPIQVDYIPYLDSLYTLSVPSEWAGRMGVGAS